MGHDLISGARLIVEAHLLNNAYLISKDGGRDRD
jgi:hypothetical protein